MTPHIIVSPDVPTNDSLLEDLPDEDPPSFIFLALTLATGVGDVSGSKGQPHA